jgi:biotin transport system substrate-specific component
MFNSKITNITVTGLFAAIIIVLAQLSIPIQPIPFTLAVFAIFLTGALLPPKNAGLAVLIYLILGAIGLPIFAGQKGGIGVLFGATGGFLIAYPLMALAISVCADKIKFNRIVALSIGMITAMAICYSLGSVWFMFVVKASFIKAMTACVIPFIPFDLLKAALAITFSLAVRKAIPQLKKENA